MSNSSDTDARRGTPFTDVTNRQSVSPTASMPDVDSQSNGSPCSVKRISLSLQKSKLTPSNSPSKCHSGRYHSPSYNSMSPFSTKSPPYNYCLNPSRDGEPCISLPLSTLENTKENSPVEDPFLSFSVMPFSLRDSNNDVDAEEHQYSPTRRSATLNPSYLHNNLSSKSFHDIHRRNAMDLSSSLPSTLPSFMASYAQYKEDEDRHRIEGGMMMLDAINKNESKESIEANEQDMFLENNIHGAQAENLEIRECNLDLLHPLPSLALDSI
eukprot:Tbor_TRINITY_DN5539_c0_g1::TRINITY_DN5539_c0_g1_i4::g.13806::m.13806